MPSPFTWNEATCNIKALCYLQMATKKMSVKRTFVKKYV